MILIYIWIFITTAVTAYQIMKFLTSDSFIASEPQEGNIMKNYKIELYTGKDGWRWRVKSRNGKILAFSEAYKTRQAALKTALAVKMANLIVEDK